MAVDLVDHCPKVLNRERVLFLEIPCRGIVVHLFVAHRVVVHHAEESDDNRDVAQDKGEDVVGCNHGGHESWDSCC